jgi:hypothetical protein
VRLAKRVGLVLVAVVALIFVRLSDAWSVLAKLIGR